MTELNLRKTKLAMDVGPSVGFVYKRVRNGVQRAEVRFDGVAGCLRTPEGGSSRQIVLALEDRQARSRLLSPREAARLMGVPDRCWLPPKYNDAYRAMGDGVAVPVGAVAVGTASCTARHPLPRFSWRRARREDSDRCR